MPMAKKKLNTVARLAMGTAILTVISGCDNRIGQGISDTAAPMTRVLNDTSVVVTETLTPAAQAVARAPGIVLETVSPSTTAIIEPEYVVPGTPTYTEFSQAANVQTFESIYGPPVSTDPSQAVAASYAIPSYDDGSVTAQPLAPVTSYTQQVTTAIAPAYEAPAYDAQAYDAPAYDAPTYQAMPDSAAGFVYGDTLTSEGYTVVTEPVAAIPAPMVGTFDTAEFRAVEPVAFETYETFETLPAAAVPAMPVTTVPVATETYTIDSMPTFAPDAMVVEPMSRSLSVPMIGDDTSAALSYGDTIPMTDASAEFVVMSEPMAFEAMAEPVAFEATMDALPPLAGAEPYDRSERTLSSVFGGVQIIGNDEAQATYGATPAPDGTGEAVPFETLSYGQPLTSFETAVLSETLETTPLPSPKRARPAPFVDTVALTMEGPLTAPVPRRRPAGEVGGDYATLSAPLPQPRPDYDNPVASATTAGAYVSIGALPAAGEEPTVAQAPDAPVAIRAASIQTTEPTTPEPETAGELSELSGTSWRLAEVGGEAVSVNTELHFDGASGFAGGQGPCNSYGGEFVNAGKGLFSMANIFATDTSCPTIGIEQQYLEALKNAGSYEITTGFSEMTLLDRDGQPIVRFKAF